MRVLITRIFCFNYLKAEFAFFKDEIGALKCRSVVIQNSPRTIIYSAQIAFTFSTFVIKKKLWESRRFITLAKKKYLGNLTYSVEVEWTILRPIERQNFLINYASAEI